MSKALELISTLIDGANEYEKKTGNTNPTVYLSRNNLMVIEQALLKAQEPMQYVDELKLVEKSLKALEIIKEKNVDIITLKKSNTLKDYIKSATIRNLFEKGVLIEELTEEEFNLLKEVLEWAD